MKQLMKIAIVTLAFPLTLLAGRSEPQEPRQPQKQSGMMESCKAMMADREKMMAEIRSSQEKLDELVSRMNAAEGNAKVEALEEVVSELVAERRKATDRMQAMQGRMMEHMMQHMREGMMRREGQAMECPMMKEMAKS